MRLTCPNCGAQYEVDASMIPAEGRDVQCSNCAQTWFQEPEGAPLALGDPIETPGDSLEERVAEFAADETTTVEEVETVSEPGPGIDSGTDTDDTADGETATGADEDETDTGWPEDVPPPEMDAGDEDWPEDPDAPDDTPVVEATFIEDADDADAPAGDLPRPSEQLDRDRLSVLIEEAARESEARRSEEGPGGLETQPDLGLDQAEDATSTALSAHIARMRAEAAGTGEESDPKDTATDPAGARSDLLPDIDEINSSLRPANEHAEVHEVADPAIAERQQRKGARLSFTFVVLIAALLIMAYVFAPQLAEQFPQAEPALARYVETANAARDAVDRALDAAVTAMSGETAE